RFLVVVVDQELHWKEQTIKTVARGAAYSVLLQCLMATSWGMPAKMTCQLYQAVTPPKTLYAASVWLRPMYDSSTDSPIPGLKGVARKLAQTLHAVAIAIPGAMRRSPTDLLDVHTHFLPAALAIQK
ncbi:hypothetical protein F5J12DRAFT_707689, partial [Pisolithus orientalis]|uniref:uncharacterized protein n=1 Tax=Pisolithus orientalis TaxID=936130 RepID=UPI00222508B2